MKLTLPPMVEDRNSWGVYSVQPQSEPSPDTRSLYRRFMYAALMYLHDRAESFWHWCWNGSRRYAPPPARMFNSYDKVGEVKGELYGFIPKVGVVRPIDN